MSEPLLQADAQLETSSLWDKAPAWRNLTVGASLLTLAALALPLLPAQEAAPEVALAPIDNVVVTPARVLPAPVQVAALPPQTPVKHATPIPPQTVPQQAAPQAQQQSCAITLPDTPAQMSGTVVGFIPHDQSLLIFSNTERNRGGVVNPAFVNDVRVLIRPDPGTRSSAGSSVVPSRLTVAIGDHITYQTPYRDPAMACGFFPSQVTADQGPVSASQPPQQAAAATDLSTPRPQVASLPPQQSVPPQDLSALPVGTEIVSSGVLARINRHNRGDLPVSITIISPPAHGTVTSQQGTAPFTSAGNGVTRISPVTSVFYQSVSGYVGPDTFTYKRTSPDPNDPFNANTYTMNIYVK